MYRRYYSLTRASGKVRKIPPIQSYIILLAGLADVVLPDVGWYAFFRELLMDPSWYFKIEDISVKALADIMKALRYLWITLNFFQLVRSIDVFSKAKLSMHRTIHCIMRKISAQSVQWINANELSYWLVKT